MWVAFKSGASTASAPVTSVTVRSAPPGVLSYNIKPPSAWESYMKNQDSQQQQQYMKSYPDLVLSQDQENASGGSSSGNQQPRLESLMEQKKLNLSGLISCKRFLYSFQVRNGKPSKQSSQLSHPNTTMILNICIWRMNEICNRG